MSISNISANSHVYSSAINPLENLGNTKNQQLIRHLSDILQNINLSQEKLSQLTTVDLAQIKNELITLSNEMLTLTPLLTHQEDLANTQARSLINYFLPTISSYLELREILALNDYADPNDENHILLTYCKDIAEVALSAIQKVASLHTLLTFSIQYANSSEHLDDINTSLNGVLHWFKSNLLIDIESAQCAQNAIADSNEYNLLFEGMKNTFTQILEEIIHPILEKGISDPNIQKRLKAISLVIQDFIEAPSIEDCIQTYNLLLFELKNSISL